MTTYIDVHILQTVPPSCINRDDTGSPKSAMFGGTRRHRVSSQAWKRAARAEFSRHLDPSELGERTKQVVDRVRDRIEEIEPSFKETAEQMAVGVLEAAGIKVAKPKRARKSEDTVDRFETGYLAFFSRAQIDALARLAINSLAGKIDKKAAKAAATGDRSIDVALFGRMIADAPDLNVDACCQVAHALSVHSAATEFDYFTAVDDNAPKDNAGAEMIGTVEFVSSTLYRYATINADELATSLGSVEAAAKAVEAFVRAFVVSMPTGKQNTFANRTLPSFVMAEVRDDQPVNLVEAFEEPIEETRGRVAEAVRRLVDEADSIDAAYGAAPVLSRHLATGAAAPSEVVSTVRARSEHTDLPGLVESLAVAVRERVDIR